MRDRFQYCVSAIRLNLRVNKVDKRRLLGQTANAFFSLTVYGLLFRVGWKPDVRFCVQLFAGDSKTRTEGA